MTFKTLQIVGDSKYGGASYLIQQWCEFLSKQACDVHVLARDLVLTEGLEKIPRVHIVDNIVIPRDISPLQDIRALVQLVRLLRHEDYSVVHTYTSAPGFLGRCAARLVGVPVILHHQAGWVATQYSSIFKRLLYSSLEYLATLASTKGICVSYATAQQARDYSLAPRNKLVVICNGIDPKPFVDRLQAESVGAFRRSLRIPSDHVVIGNTGRLAPPKDHETLIRSLVPLKELIPDTPFTLLLAGDGPERQRLEGLAHSTGYKGQVRFLGFIREIPLFLEATDLFVCPSAKEGLSISLLEAMAAAKPIITSSIAANAELIKHEVTGLLVPPSSPVLLAEAIARFVLDPDLAGRCSTAARNLVLENFTISRMFDETWHLYKELLRTKKD